MVSPTAGFAMRHRAHSRLVLVSLILLSGVALGTADGSLSQPAVPVSSWALWLPVDTQHAATVTDPNFGVGAAGDEKWQPTPSECTRWTREALDLIVYERLNPLRAARVLAPASRPTASTRRRGR